MKRDAVALEISKQPEQREVGFGGGFVKPFQPVRPRAMVDHPGQMRVQREGEKARRQGARCGGNENLRCEFMSV